MARSERGSGLVDARGVATYLVSLRPVLKSATETRQVWVKRIGLLMADTRHGNPALIQQQAGQIGRDHGNDFRNTQSQLDRLKAPRECSICQQQLTNWLAKLVRSCDVLAEIGRDGDLKRLRETQSLLTEARAHAHAFNTEYARLCETLREHVSAVASRQREKKRAAPPGRARS